jgi:serine/threonine-protein kinase
MSEVWAAEDVELGRRVAIKLLGSDADPARFDREARAVAALAHPHICQLYDYGEENGRPFMVLEYLGGGTLEDRLVPGEKYPDTETRRIALELATGLGHAHERGVVHRDLKPANVLFDDEGRAKIADFGIARLGGAGTLTEAGTLLGTAAYISPEQATGQPATPASDVYSFGVILYRMLAGRLPFEAEDALKLAAMHVNERPAPIGAAPADLAALAEAALAKAPEARPADGATLVAALGEGGATRASAGTPPVPPTEATIPIPQTGRPRWPSQRRATPLIVAAVLALAAGGVALAVLAGTGSNTSGPTAPSHHHSASAASTQASAPATATATSTATSTPPATTGPSTTLAPPPPTPPPTPPPPTTAPTTVPATTLPVTTT